MPGSLDAGQPDTQEHTVELYTGTVHNFCASPTSDFHAKYMPLVRGMRYGEGDAMLLWGSLSLQAPRRLPHAGGVEYSVHLPRPARLDAQVAPGLPPGHYLGRLTLRLGSDRWMPRYHPRAVCLATKDAVPGTDCAMAVTLDGLRPVRGPPDGEADTTALGPLYASLRASLHGVWAWAEALLNEP